MGTGRAFCVYPNAISVALKSLKLTHQKDAQDQERGPEKRIAYLRELRAIITARGAQDIVYVDACGFEPGVCRRYG